MFNVSSTQAGDATDQKRDQRNAAFPRNAAQTCSEDEANVFNIHVHNVCSKSASCLLHRVNGVL